ncbi:MAG: hypothetical protein JXP36_16215 [Bacteroidales bacterium]|nr:hypothetical protein [Bacteroidales bacterium]
MLQIDKKWFLYSGLFLIAFGVILKLVTAFNLLALVIIFTGAGSKVLYLFLKFLSKEYVPGTELKFLIVGLILFLAGNFVIQKPEFLSLLLKITGVSLKIIFVLLFILKQRNAFGRNVL